MTKNNNPKFSAATELPATRRQLIKGIGLTAAWSTPVVQSLILPAHAQTSSGPIESFTELSNWWETPASMPITERRVLSVVVSFTNVSGVDIDFSATAADTIQVWSTPSVGSPTMVFSVSPAGSTVLAGGSYSYEFTVDFATAPGGDTGLAFRPRSINLGTMGPGQAQMDVLSIT